MKKGDKFVSRKTIKELDFHKDNTYEYVGRIMDIIYFSNIELEKRKIVPFGVTINEFYDYFYTEKEIRKKKLDEINEQ